MECCPKTDGTTHRSFPTDFGSSEPCHRVCLSYGTAQRHCRHGKKKPHDRVQKAHLPFNIKNIPRIVPYVPAKPYVHHVSHNKLNRGNRRGTHGTANQKRYFRKPAYKIYKNKAHTAGYKHCPVCVAAPQYFQSAVACAAY